MVSENDLFDMENSEPIQLFMVARFRMRFIDEKSREMRQLSN